MYCQVVNGPRRADGFGRTDGEGQERDWSGKSHLVAAGRSCGAETRRQMLDRQSRHFVNAKLENLPKHMVELWDRASSVRQSAMETLEHFIDGPPLEFRSMQDEVLQVDWTMEFVAEQARNEVEFFTSVSQGKKASKGNQEIFQALKVERAFERKLRKTPLNENSDERVRHQWLTILPAKKQRTDAVLNKYGQIREDWSEDSSRWKESEACATLSPGAEIYVAIEAERKYELGQRSSLEERGLDVAKCMRRDKNMKKLRKKTSTILRKHKTTRTEWQVGSNNYHIHKRREVVTKLQNILAEILQQVTSRAVEMKSVHSRVRGQKQANPILKSLYRRFPRIKALIDKFNETLAELPYDPRIPAIKPLSLETFHPETGDETIDSNTEAARFMPLMQLDILSCLCFGDQLQDPNNPDTVPAGVTDDDMRDELSIYRKLTASGTWFAWGLSDDVNAAIQCYHRVARADEERSIVAAEARRLSAWIHARVQGLLAALDHHELALYRTHLLPMLWRDARILFQVSRFPQELLAEDRTVSKELVERAYDRLCETSKQDFPTVSDIMDSNEVDVNDPDGSVADELYPYVVPDEGITEMVTSAMDYISGQRDQAAPQDGTNDRQVAEVTLPDNVSGLSSDSEEDRDYTVQSIIAGMRALPLGVLDDD